MKTILEMLAWLHGLPGVDAEMSEIFQAIVDALWPEE